MSDQMSIGTADVGDAAEVLGAHVAGSGQVPGADAVVLTRAAYEALKAKGEQVADLHDPVHFAHEHVANAEANVERHRAFLAGAEEELERARAELARVELDQVETPEGA